MPDVYLVTIRQLLAWMEAPIPTDQLTPALLGCGNVGGAGPTGQQPRSGAGGLASAVPVLAPAPATAPVPAPAPAPDLGLATWPGLLGESLQVGAPTGPAKQ